MKLNPRERSVAISLFCSQGAQQIVDFGQYKASGGEGSIAHRCGLAAKEFCRVGAERNADGRVSAVALSAFCCSIGKFLFGGTDAAGVAKEAFVRAEGMLAEFEVEEESKPQVVQASVAEEVIPPQVPVVIPPQVPVVEPSAQVTETITVEVKPVDVPTEQLELPEKTISLLLSLSTADIDLTSAAKIRAQDKKQSIEKLKDIGHAIRKKVLEAVDKAIGPEVTA